MKPAPFELLRPDSLADALDTMDTSEGETKALAGGQSLVPLMALRLATPTVLVDLNRVSELAGVTPRPNGVVRFGAMTRHSTLVGSTEHPLIGEAARWVGHTAIRTRGTVGGSLAHADPSAELPCVAVACDAMITARSSGSTRTIGAGDFFTGMFGTGLGDHELLTAVDLVRPRRWGFAELAGRDGDFALVLAVVAEHAAGWRVVLGGVGPTPWRCHAAERVLTEVGPIEEAPIEAALIDAGPAEGPTDQPPSDQGSHRGPTPFDGAPGTGLHTPRRTGADAVASAVGDAVADTVEAFDDIHADAAYRRAMAAHIATRAAAQALTLGGLQ